MPALNPYETLLLQNLARRPGEVFFPRQMAKVLGFSTASASRAINRLAVLGLVVIIPSDIPRHPNASYLTDEGVQKAVEIEGGIIACSMYLHKRERGGGFVQSPMENVFYG